MQASYSAVPRAKCGKGGREEGRRQDTEEEWEEESRQEEEQVGFAVSLHVEATAPGVFYWPQALVAVVNIFVSASSLYFAEMGHVGIWVR